MQGINNGYLCPISPLCFDNVTNTRYAKSIDSYFIESFTPASWGEIERKIVIVPWTIFALFSCPSLGGCRGQNNFTVQVEWINYHFAIATNNSWILIHYLCLFVTRPHINSTEQRQKVLEDWASCLDFSCFTHFPSMWSLPTHQRPDHWTPGRGFLWYPGRWRRVDGLLAMCVVFK